MFALLVALLALLLQWVVGHRARVYGLADKAWRRLLKSGPAQAAFERWPRLWTFVGARLTPGEYLGLHFTAGLLFSVAAMTGFMLVAYDVFRRDQLVSLDRGVLRFLRTNVPDLVEPFLAVTFMGNGPTLAILALGIAVWLGMRKQRALLYGWLAAVIGAGLMERGLKFLFQRERPTEALVRLPSSWSFPSGHAMVSLVTYGMLAYVLWLIFRRMRARAALVGLLATLVVAIGFSRVYLGVHYFSDVVGGYAAGTTWLVACISGLEVVRRKRALRPS